MRIQRVDSIDSTSLALKREIAAGRLRGADGPVVLVAGEQRGGVGRFGRPWSSPRGGLWCTAAAPLPAGPHPALDGLGLRLGVGCVRMVRDLMPEPARPDVRLKWPNDVVIRGRKVLGVLTELVDAPGATERWVVVGIGLNANFSLEALPESLRAGATTLRDAGVGAVDLDALPTSVGRMAMDALATPGIDAQTLAEARRFLHGIGEEAMVSLPTGGKVRAMLVGLDRWGNAVFEQDGSRWPAPAATVIGPAAGSPPPA